MSAGSLDLNATSIELSTCEHQGEEDEEVSAIEPGDDVDPLSSADAQRILIWGCSNRIVGYKECPEVGVVKCRAGEADDGEEGGVGTKSIVLEVNGELGFFSFNGKKQGHGDGGSKAQNEEGVDLVLSHFW